MTHVLDPVETKSRKPRGERQVAPAGKAAFLALPTVTVTQRTSPTEIRLQAIRHKNFSLLYDALGKDAAVLAEKTHIAIGRVHQFLAQEAVIDTQMAEHLGHMLGVGGRWFDQTRQAIDPQWIESIRHHVNEEDMDAGVDSVSSVEKEKTELQGEAMDASDAQPPSGASREVKIDRWPEFAAWLRQMFDEHVDVRQRHRLSDATSIPRYQVNGWLTSPPRRRMFRSDMLAVKAFFQAEGAEWVEEMELQYNHLVVHQQQIRGRKRHEPSHEAASVEDVAGASTSKADFLRLPLSSAPAAPVGAVKSSKAPAASAPMDVAAVAPTLKTAEPQPAAESPEAVVEQALVGVADVTEAPMPLDELQERVNSGQFDTMMIAQEIVRSHEVAIRTMASVWAYLRENEGRTPRK